MDLTFPVDQSHNLMCKGEGIEWEADDKRCIHMVETVL